MTNSIKHFKETKNADKVVFVYYVHKVLLKNGNKISRHHVESIFNFLMDELKNFLIINKKMKLNNFGIFKFSRRGARKIKSILTGEIKIARSTNKIQFFLHDKLKKLLIQYLNIEKTLGENAK
jgi:nucleoid DNA-binding protein